MKPFPAQTPNIVNIIDPGIPSLPPVLTATSTAYSTSNRRASAGPTPRAYPFLLLASTVVAGAFCVMYIIKPVIQASPAVTPQYAPHPGAVKTAPPPAELSMMPDKDRLPGEKPTSTALPSASTTTTAFEQSNLRVQHILTAESPGGHLSKIDLDVPVIYQSGNLRWTPAEVAEARELLARLADYQEKARMLRLEGVELSGAWNRMIKRSIPATDLRADSPTLPVNRQGTADAPRPADLDTTGLIQIQPAGK